MSDGVQDDSASTHRYLSTACWHEIHDSDPAWHGNCRKTCKSCDAPCTCRNHPERDSAPPVLPWVDQAREVAKQLLAVIVEFGPVNLLDTSLARRIETDPDLFWLRDEVQPHGQWRADPNSH